MGEQRSPEHPPEPMPLKEIARLPAQLLAQASQAPPVATVPNGMGGSCLTASGGAAPLVPKIIG